MSNPNKIEQEKPNKRKIEVVADSGDWKAKYEAESATIKGILNDIIVNMHHIGSTAIPGIKAKPVIDILVEVSEIEKVDAYNEDLEEIGYEAMGEYGIKGRRFFMKGGNNRSHHVHIFQFGNREVKRHIDFKEYMIAHPKEAKEYSDLKERLAALYPYDIESYVKGKDGLIKDIDQRAIAWRQNDSVLHSLNSGIKEDIMF